MSGTMFQIYSSFYELTEEQTNLQINDKFFDFHKVFPVLSSNSN
jgi:hypothetical protein